MLPAKYRLRNKNDINKVYRRGQFFSFLIFAVYFLPNRLDANRFAFVISNKVIKKSSGRNLLRRKLRSAVYEYVKQCQNDRRVDVIFRIVKEPTAPYNYQQIKKGVEVCLKKLSLI